MKSEEEDPPRYLLHATLDRERRDVVHLNLRLSEEPESTALLNEIPLGRFREILVNKFGMKPEQVDPQIDRMRLGYSYGFPLFMTEEHLYETGLLTRYQSG